MDLFEKTLTQVNLLLFNPKIDSNQKNHWRAYETTSALTKGFNAGYQLGASTIHTAKKEAVREKGIRTNGLRSTRHAAR